MIFQKIKKLWLLPLIFIFMAASAEACEIDFTILKGKKKTYQAGDKLMIKVSVYLTHGNCPEGIESTKFILDGIKVTASTKWSQNGRRYYERKLKVIVEESGKAKASISAERLCDKEGGYGELKLPVQ